jgi:hypothetical protein
MRKTVMEEWLRPQTGLLERDMGKNRQECIVEYGS